MRFIKTTMKHYNNYEGAPGSYSVDPKVPPEYNVTTWEIPLDSPEHINTAGLVLSGLHIWVPGVNGFADATGIYFDTAPPVNGDPADYAANWAALRDLVHSTGWDWTETYTLESSQYGATVDVRPLIKVGVAGSVVTSTLRLTDYRHWNGSEYVQRKGCVPGN